jgi:ligand-binding sensor domain-containing protein
MTGFKRSIFSVSLYFTGLLLLFSEALAAQNFNVRTFTTNDGLSHNDVRAMAVDSSGFLWIATWDGLSRYDGYSFKNYYHQTDDSLSLPYFSIKNVLVDGGNNLWLFTDDYLVAKYDRTNDIFRIVNQLYDSLPQNFAQISIDESGYLWLINQESLFRFDFAKSKFDKYELIDSTRFRGKLLIDNLSYNISTSGNDRVWVVGSKILEFEKSTGNKLNLKEEYFIDKSTLNSQYDFDYNY